MIRQDRTDDVLTVTIDNRDQANALTEEMLGQLIDAFTEADADEGLRAVLLTSAGGRGFSAGMDTAQFAHTSASRAYATVSRLGEVCEAIKNCALPIAVAIDGYCIGGAAEIAAAADFRIGSSESWYSMPEVRIGIPSVLESVNLHRVMGWTKATEFVLTGNRFTAEDMLRCGFLNDIVAEEATPAGGGTAVAASGSGRTALEERARPPARHHAGQPRRHRAAEATAANVEEHLRNRGDRRQSEGIRARLRREGRETVA